MVEFCSQSAKMSLIGDSIAEDFLRNFQEICQKAYLAKDQETSASVLSIKFLLIKCYHLPFVRILLNLANFGVAEEAIVWRCSVEKFFIEISRNSKENVRAKVSFLTKLRASACNSV